MPQLHFQNRFASLGETFFAQVRPSALSQAYFVAHSESAAQLLGLEGSDWSAAEFANIFNGNQVHATSLSLAAVYSGHQFGVWAGQLGDGRALLLGDLAQANGQEMLEVQLKGSGSTPFSRMGDGRAVLRSSIREFLCSEAMAALGIPTSRALCLYGSDQYVMREQPEKTAILTRLAPSFIRFGSFEHWYYSGQIEPLKSLADFLIAHYFPDCSVSSNPYQALLKIIIERTADLFAHWQAVGFMHGVLNTDNMSVLGITLDYGPFGFMEAYDPQHICNHSDTAGRYSFENQPEIGHWNCHALAQALMPLLDDVESTQAILAIYPERFEASYRKLLQAKFGLQRVESGDEKRFAEFFELMHLGQADYSFSFRQLAKISRTNAAQDHHISDWFINREQVNAWLDQYRQRLQREDLGDTERAAGMNKVNPKFILRNYLAQQAIEKAEQKDFSEITRLLKVLASPFDEQEEFEQYAALPPDWAQQIAVSCSS